VPGVRVIHCGALGRAGARSTIRRCTGSTRYSRGGRVDALKTEWDCGVGVIGGGRGAVCAGSKNWRSEWLGHTRTQLKLAVNGEHPAMAQGGRARRVTCRIATDRIVSCRIPRGRRRPFRHPRRHPRRQDIPCRRRPLPCALAAAAQPAPAEPSSLAAAANASAALAAVLEAAAQAVVTLRSPRPPSPPPSSPTPHPPPPSPPPSPTHRHRRSRTRHRPRRRRPHRRRPRRSGPRVSETLTTNAPPAQLSPPRTVADDAIAAAARTTIPSPPPPIPLPLSPPYRIVLNVQRTMTQDAHDTQPIAS
jgi:hypothetical protein